MPNFPQEQSCEYESSQQRILNRYMPTLRIGTGSFLVFLTSVLCVALLLVQHRQKTNLSAFGPEFSAKALAVQTANITIAAAVPQRAKILPGRAFAVATKRRLDLQLPGQQSWEPSIMITRDDAGSANNDEVIATFMDGRATATLTDTRIAIAQSGDGGNSWNTTELVPPPAATKIQFDPMSAYDASTGRAYVGAMSRNFSAGIIDTIWLATRSAAATNFSASAIVIPVDGVDKGWMAAGALPAPQVGSALYLAFNAPNQHFVSKSLDGGFSFGAPLVLPPTIAYQPRVAANGVLSISYYGAGFASIIKSMDGLQTLNAPVNIAPFTANPTALSNAVPGTFRIPYFVVHAIDPNNGKIYLVYNDVTDIINGEADVNLLLRDSIDGGQTWSAPRIVNGDGAAGGPAGDQIMPWIECDSFGRLHLSYFDNRRNPSFDGAQAGLFDVYYALSSDGGTSWQEQRLTDTPLASSSSVWNPLGDGVQFLGDYLGLAVSKHAAYVAYPGDDNGATAMWVTRIDLRQPGEFADGFE